MLWKRIDVRNHERVLVAKNEKFHAILGPGNHYVFVAPGVRIDIERFTARDVVFRSAWAEYLYRERRDIFSRYFECIETNDVQVAMIYVDGKLFNVLPPGERCVMWRGVAQITTEIVDVMPELDLDDEDSDLGDDPLFEILLQP
jgi:hypothetical protein